LPMGWESANTEKSSAFLFVLLALCLKIGNF
jgi:hypothetical protein